MVRVSVVDLQGVEFHQLDAILSRGDLPVRDLGRDRLDVLQEEGGHAVDVRSVATHEAHEDTTAQVRGIRRLTRGVLAPVERLALIRDNLDATRPPAITVAPEHQLRALLAGGEDNVPILPDSSTLPDHRSAQEGSKAVNASNSIRIISRKSTYYSIGPAADFDEGI